MGGFRSTMRVHGCLLMAVRSIAATVLLWAGVASAADPCTPVVARVVSVTGRVDLERPGAAPQQAVSMDAALCAGDSVRVHKYGGLSLRLINETTIRLDQGTTLTLAPPADGKPSLLQQWSGRLHMITRTPRAFGVKTPFVNANIQGTELTVRVTDRSATVSVVEGVVVADNDAGSERLVSGEAATAFAGAAPRKDLAVRSADAVAWAVHFPTVFDPGRDTAQAGTAAGEALRARVAALYRAGRPADALDALDESSASGSDASLQRLRASLLLLVGQPDDARTVIEALVRARPDDGDALALLAIMAVVDNRSDAAGERQALTLARRAVATDPRSVAARVALSYALQASFDIDGALAEVVEAVRLEPDHALAHARRAELEMSLGRLDAALSAAGIAVALRPELSRTQSVFGFASLVRLDTASARASFERAVRLDPADPLPRLGLGLARIRDGDLAGGRADLETAAILDPRNALVRSYLGKAYFEEGREALAAEQFVLAAEHDPRDPTPHFYDAVRLFAVNRPVEAQREFFRSIELNDHRAVIRSRLLLDDDRAARSTSLASLFAELGFARLALAESVRALSDNAGNDAAHRQLASVYADLRRHDIARVSEALQAEIRQPLSLSPIDPQLSNDNLGILRGSGPSRLGASEFNQLFARDGVRVQFDAVGGNRSVRGDQLVISGVSGRLGYGLSQLHYETDGFRQNSRAEKNSLDLFAQLQLVPAASVQVHLKDTDFSLGQTFLPFDELEAFPVTIKERSRVARLSGRFVQAADRDWVVSAAQEQRVRSVEYAPDGSLVTQTDARSRAFSLQHLGRYGDLQLTAGIESLHERDTFPIETGDIVSDSRTLYAYGLWRALPSRLALHLGAAVERVDIRNSSYEFRVERHRVSPKLGLVWTPDGDTTVRLAAFSSVKRPFIASQTLEPTQVAGFNQFFSGFDTFYGDPDGTVSRRRGLGIDRRLGGTLFVGAEATARRLDVPSFIAATDFRWNERTVHLYLYDTLVADPARWPAPGWSMARSVEYEVERIVRPQVLTGPEGIVEVTTHSVPIGLRLFRGHMAWRIGTTYVRQEGVFAADVGYERFHRTTSGWLTDLSAEYRLPARRGSLVVGVRNAFDKSLDLFQVDPLNPQHAIGRFVYARVRLVY